MPLALAGKTMFARGNPLRNRFAEGERKTATAFHFWHAPYLTHVLTAERRCVIVVATKAKIVRLPTNARSKAGKLA